MERLIIICTVLILAAGAIVSIVDAIHTNYQRKLVSIIKEQNSVLRQQNDILLKNLSSETEIISILIKSEEKSNE